MTGQNQGRWATWICVAVVAAAAAIAVYALPGAAEGASLNGRTFGSARIAAAADASSTSNIVLAGGTAQRFPVFFKVSSDGKMVLTGGVALVMTCTSGATVVWPDGFSRVPIHAGGKLHATYVSPTILTNGTASTMRDVLVAKLNSKHSQLTGTWRLAVNFGFSDGSSDKCDSGPVHFTATG